MNQLEKQLRDAPAGALGFQNQGGADSASQITRIEVETGTHQLETLLCSSIDPIFDKFELYVLRNILSIPSEDADWIRLEHYRDLDFHRLTHGPDTPTTSSVGHLRRRLQSSYALNHMLETELRSLNTLLEELRTISGVASGCADVVNKADNLGFLLARNDLHRMDPATPLTTTTAFSSSQLSNLRALSASLSPLMESLRQRTKKEDGLGQRPTMWAQERVAYVEGRVRRHLETVDGLDLTETGRPLVTIQT